MQLSVANLKELVIKIADEGAFKIVRYILDKQNISEFVIAEKLGMTVNEVRNKLYKLQTYNLVSSTRKKDKEKGWYIYYWTFKQKDAYELFYNLKQKKLKELKDTLEKEDKTKFLICKNECKRLTFEESLEEDFKCPVCGTLLKEESNKKNISTIRKELINLEKELTKVKA